jgi:phosphate transport system substrate-binding protein
MSYFIKIFLFLILLFSKANANERIRIIGSSTIFPFMNNVAEEFAEEFSYPVPIVESVGTGGGFKAFCAMNNNIDIANASRLISESELQYCHANGVVDLYQLKLGYDGVVLANMNTAFNYSLTSYELFLALSENVAFQGEVIKNPYKYWHEINPNLPKSKIKIYGPSSSSGTRDIIIEKIIMTHCMSNNLFVGNFPDPEKRKNYCGLIRNDGSYINMGEDDNVIVHKLIQNPDALGFFGYYFIYNNKELLQASKINLVEPHFKNIESRAYILARPLYIYFKDIKGKKNDMLKKFVKFIASKQVIGKDGFLLDKGFIPLDDNELKYNAINHIKN